MIKKSILFVIKAVLLMSCAQAPTEKAITAEDKALQKGLEMLSDAAVTDKSESLSAFEQACKLGSHYGCHKIGIAYNNELYGKEKDYQKAREWYLKAAEKGYVPSQQNIANLYAYRLLPMNDIEGYKWLKLAEAGATKCLPGSIEVESNTPEVERRRLCQLATAGQGRLRSFFRKRMTVQEIHQAEENARKWQPKP